MPPKPKETGKKERHPSLIRAPISSLSLYQIPNDAVEGYQHRIETGIEWTVLEEAARRHRKMCMATNIPICTFSEALKCKLDESIIGGFIDQNCTITLEDNWEAILPMTMWDQEKFATKEEKICFNSKNSITDNIENIIQKAVKAGNREVLRKELMDVTVLRLNSAEITELDKTLRKFKNLVNLVLCGNYIREIDVEILPTGIKMVELQANAISNLDFFQKKHSCEIYYLGLARNLLNNDSLDHFNYLPYSLTVLDLGDNDIYDLTAVLEVLIPLEALISLVLAGNPCAVCTAYAVGVLRALPRLRWLDYRDVEPSEDLTIQPNKQTKHQQQQHPPLEINPDDFRSAHFFFKVVRIMSVPPPPKHDKGALGNFHIEVEIPLLDSKRRDFLMFFGNEFLVEDLPEPEGGWPENETLSQQDPAPKPNDADTLGSAEQSHSSDIYRNYDIKTSRQIRNYKVFESHGVQWNNIMTFQDPIVRILCPDLVALRNTFRSFITVRLVYTLTIATKSTKDKNQSLLTLKSPDHRVVLATIKCPLRRPDWTQAAQHFHWDDSLDTNEAIHWENGDLECLQYYVPGHKSRTNVSKPSKHSSNEQLTKRSIPDNFTCHFSFGIETMRESL